MAETWARVRVLFDGALDREPAARDAWLDDACGDDRELRELIGQLLDLDQRAGDFLDRPLVAHPMDDGSLSDGEGDPHRVGPYRVLRRIGQGGLGTVYLGVRDDDTFERRVVVKLVRHDLENPDLQRRLRAERQILASLRHPNIAELYDGGTTEDRRPYFVMEYVDGVPIDVFCEQRQLSVDERLALFTKVCKAVQYAHQNLIVHRDIKPSNILVTADGEPKLLDFGIAKLLNPELAAWDLEQTATWLRLMTPHYASPEQVRGKLVTTASDVYSLGVLLYLLLTGRLPHRFERLTPAEIERVLTEGDPPRPSIAVTSIVESGEDETSELPSTGEDSRHLGRRLAGDLDAIVMKALRSAPQRRYPSADRLVEDLDRYRGGLPVAARQGDWRYRTAKFLRRHRLAVGFGTVLAAIVLVAAALLIRQSNQVVFERDVARHERQRKDVVLDVMLDLLKVADPTVGDGERWTVLEALESSEAHVRRRFRDEPELLAEVLHSTGQIYLNLGLWDRAVDQLEDAVRLRSGLHGEAHPEVAISRGALALALAESGESDRAIELSATAVESLRSNGRPDDLLDVLNHRVTVLCHARDYATAEAPAAEALALARQSPEENLHGLASAIVNQATIRLRAKDYDRAAELYQESLQIRELLVGDDHLSLVPSINNLGAAFRRSDRLDQAEAAYSRSLAIQQRTLGDDHANLAFTLNNLATVARQKGAPATAAERYRAALDVFRRHAGDEHPRVLFLEVNLAMAEIGAGEPAAAVDRLRRILPTWRERLGEEHAFVLDAEAVIERADGPV